MLDVQTKNAEEFEKANITLKTIRIEKNGRPKESMSFPAFTIKELVNEEWDDSEIHKFFTETRFLFFVFENLGDTYRLKGAKFWNMPYEDIETDLKNEWILFRDTFRKGVKFKYEGSRMKNSLPKASDTNILHVRPHADKSVYLIDGKKYGNGNLKSDSDELPNGDRMTKQCFWLNDSYVGEQVFKLFQNESSDT